MKDNYNFNLSFKEIADLLVYLYNARSVVILSGFEKVIIYPEMIIKKLEDLINNREDK